MRYRLGNEMREGWYWGEESGMKCRLCGRGIESWEHIWKSCKNWKKVGEESW